MLNCFKLFLPLIMLIFVSACSADGSIRGIGTFPSIEGWGANNSQNQSSKPAPLKPNSVFEDRLAQITQRLNEPAPTQAMTNDGQVVAGNTNNIQKVALVVPLSGAQASLGQSMMVAGQLALQDMRSQNIQLLPRDSGMTPDSANRAVTESINEGANLILGPVFVNQVRNVKNTANTNKVPLIGFTTDWTAAGADTYVMGFLPFQQVTRVIDYAVAQNMSSVIIIAPNNHYGRLITDTATKYNGLPIKILKTVSSDTPGTIAAKTLQMMTPQTSLLFAYDGNETGQIINALATANATPANVLMMGTGILDDPAMAQNKSLEGVFFASAPLERRAQFEQRYIKLAGSQPHRLASLAYDAVALSAVLSKNKNNPQKFNAAAMRDPNGFSGVDGVFRFQDNGQIERNLAILSWKNGALVEVAPSRNRF